MKNIILLLLLLLIFTACNASPVVELTSSTFDKTVLQSEGIWIVAFVAPWCGHCQRLHPEYDKAAESLGGVVNLGTVNCDNEQSLAQRYGVRGFPTIKIFNAGKDKQSPEDYQSARSASAIVSVAMSKFNSLSDPVKKLDNAEKAQKFIDNTGVARVVLLTSKDTNPPLFKSIAIELKGNDEVELGFVPSKAQSSVSEAVFSNLKAPALLLYNKDSSSFIKYDGKMKKADMLKFILTNIPGTDAHKDKLKTEKKAEEQKRKAEEQKKKEEVKIESITSADQLKKYCDKMCVFTVVSDNDEQKKKLFADLAEEYKKHNTLKFAVVETKNSKPFVQAFGIDENATAEETFIPIVVFRGGKSKYAIKNDVTKANSEWFFEQILYGGLKFSTIEDIPSFEATHDEL
jgi:protein disulfide-isomerase A6